MQLSLDQSFSQYSLSEKLLRKSYSVIASVRENGLVATVIRSSVILGDPGISFEWPETCHNLTVATRNSDCTWNCRGQRDLIPLATVEDAVEPSYRITTAK